MKELSIEDKAKRYELALERCRKLYNEAKANEYNSDIEDYETIFPELKESEDERIRKGIIQYLEQSQFGEEPYQIDDDVVRNYIAWLKKQGEKKESPCDKCKREQPSHSCQDITELGRCALEKQGKQNPAEWHREDEQKLKCLSWLYIR